MLDRRLLAPAFLAPACLGLTVLAFLPLKLGLGWSSDDIGTAWTRTQLTNGLLSRELWSNPHFNRFPINTAYLYSVHGDALTPPWQAHFASWVLIALVAALAYAAVEAIKGRLAPDSASKSGSFASVGAVLWLLCCEPLAMSLFDVSCSHYLLAMTFFLAALTARIRYGLFWTAAGLSAVGALTSEVGLFFAAQLIVLDALLYGGWPWASRRLAWIAATIFPFVAAKASLYVAFGREALLWKGYDWSLRDIPLNVYAGFRYLLFPPHGLPAWLLGLAIIGACVALRARGRALLVKTEGDVSRRRVLLTLAVFGALVPFVFFKPPLVPRLFSELALVLALWSPILVRALRPNPVLASVITGLLVLGNGALFAKNARDALAAEVIFRAFIAREAKGGPDAEAGVLSRGAFGDSLAIAYRTPVRGPLEADWGMRLAFEDAGLRAHLFGWPALRADQRVAVDYQMRDRVCLPQSLRPQATELLVFSDRETDPPSKLDLCDASCSNCVSKAARAVLRR